MRIVFRILIVGCLALCSCSAPKPAIPESQARVNCLKFIYGSGITNQISLISTAEKGRYYTYRFLANGAVYPNQVYVDRETGTAEFRK